LPSPNRAGEMCEHAFVSVASPQPAAAAFSLWAIAAFRQLELPMEASPHILTPEEAATGEHGVVFTRRWVVELILDLAGYTTDRDLASLRALEPSCGSGAFLVPMVERLTCSARAHGRSLAEAFEAILAVDLLDANVAASRAAVVGTLTGGGIGPSTADSLAASWVRRRDFLLEPAQPRSVDVVVGNPPYIRLEAVPRARSDAYRRSCITMGGRADVYVGFYEHGLHALRPGGTLGYICADRWMRNAYGAGLRALVASGWAVKALLSLTGADAFETEVDAYPAITIISREPQVRGPLVVEGTADFGPDQASELTALAASPQRRGVVRSGYRAARLPAWFAGRAGWPTGSPDRLAVIADLEARFPPLENPATATKVGIGVATGADKVFIVESEEVAEPERLLPLALPRDIAGGTVRWSGKYLVNPWEDDGLVRLDDWPLTAAYLGRHHELLAGRHTARRGQWHKTIDRVIAGLVDRPKLYLPDFKDATFPVLDEGTTYPHHNLYWVTSERWDLQVLGGLLLSDVANLFIEAYSVRMRGGYLRFQAQYLRRIRLPRLEDVSEASAQALASAFAERDRTAATRAALPLYELDRLPV
jgi:adenine-specific DNA-methyltransferase